MMLRGRNGRRLAGLALSGAMVLAFPAVAQAADAAAAGAFRIEVPTLVSLGFEWSIAGDGNRNAQVEVSYRRKGEADWRKGLPMLRLDGEQVLGGQPRWGDPHFYDYVAPNKFAGSVLNLDPGTEYECRFVLTDPDGVTGTAEQLVTVRTRAAPRPAEGGRVYHVYPYGHEGPRQEPSFIGLMAAYFRGSDQSDHSMVCRHACSRATSSWCMRGSIRNRLSTMAASITKPASTAPRSTVLIT